MLQTNDATNNSTDLNEKIRHAAMLQTQAPTSDNKEAEQSDKKQVTFDQFNLDTKIQKALDELGFEHATTVQQKALPAVLDGKDLLVSSQTGSGKTAAFMLPTLQRVIIEKSDEFHFSKVSSPQVLVLCPTRELVTQVTQDTIKFVKHIRQTRVASVIGGMPFPKQIKQLHNAKIVVATPGRLLDLAKRRKIRLDKVETLIVDEADRMLDLGFIDDLNAIHDQACNREQTLMFSATFEGRLVTLAKEMTADDAVRIEIGVQHATNKNIKQKLQWADGFGHKKKILMHWLDEDSLKQAVVFTSTKKDTDMLADELKDDGKSVVSLHGDMPQSVRNRRIRQLREGRADILVATDVAARGLDVKDITHVINFGLPMRDEDYVHRIGRTGRAGRSGTAITIATHSEGRKIRDLERYLKEKLEVHVIEGLEPKDKPKFDNKKRGNGRRNGKGYGNKGRKYGSDSRSRKDSKGFGKNNGYKANGKKGKAAGQASARKADNRPRHEDGSINGNTLSQDNSNRSPVEGKRYNKKPYGKKPYRKEGGSNYRSERNHYGEESHQKNKSNKKPFVKNVSKGSKVNRSVKESQFHAKKPKRDGAEHAQSSHSSRKKAAYIN